MLSLHLRLKTRRRGVSGRFDHNAWQTRLRNNAARNALLSAAAAPSRRQALVYAENNRREFYYPFENPMDFSADPGFVYKYIVLPCDCLNLYSAVARPRLQPNPLIASDKSFLSRAWHGRCVIKGKGTRTG
ncbi:MAG: hypothetical protein ACYC7B_00505 [Burkholderiales bacterium]